MRFSKINTLHIHIPKTGGTTIAFEIAKTLEPRAFKRHGGKFIMRLLRDERYSVVLKMAQKSHVYAKDYREKMGEEEYDLMYKFGIIRNPFSQMRSLFSQLKVMDLKINPRFKPYKTMNFETFIMGEGEFSLEGNDTLVDQKKFLTDEEGEIIVDDIFLFEEYDKAVSYVSKQVGIDIDLNKKWRETKSVSKYTPEMIERVMNLFGDTYEFYTKVKEANVLS